MSSTAKDGVYEHWWAGRSQVEISASLGIDRKTIRKYLAPAVESGLLPGRMPGGRPASSTNRGTRLGQVGSPRHYWPHP
jgi:transposase